MDPEIPNQDILNFLYDNPNFDDIEVNGNGFLHMIDLLKLEYLERNHHVAKEFKFLSQE